MKTDTLKAIDSVLKNVKNTMIKQTENFPLMLANECGPNGISVVDTTSPMSMNIAPMCNNKDKYVIAVTIDGYEFRDIVENSDIDVSRIQKCIEAYKQLEESCIYRKIKANSDYKEKLCQQMLEHHKKLDKLFYKLFGASKLRNSLDVHKARMDILVKKEQKCIDIIDMLEQAYNNSDISNWHVSPVSGFVTYKKELRQSHNDIVIYWARSFTGEIETNITVDDDFTAYPLEYLTKVSDFKRYVGIVRKIIREVKKQSVLNK